MALKITRVIDLGNDILEVRGFDDTTMEEVVAHVWLSAMDYHYDAEHYGEDGYRHPDAQPRPMNNEEKQAYWLRLLQEKLKDKNVLFEHPDNIAVFEGAKEVA